MVKDFKYIIKRIIIGVGIALILMALKGGLIANVHAQSINVQPNTMCWITTYNDSCSMVNVTGYSVGDRTFYGNTFGASMSRARLVWNFNGNDITDKTYDIDIILFYSGKTSYVDSTRGYIQNGDNNIYSCSIDNTRYGYFSESSGVQTANGSAMVHCNNVYLSSNNFRFYLMDVGTEANTAMAVSSATITENLTVKQAEELESINDSINDSSVDETKTDDDISTMQGKIASNGSISQLLTLPISLFQNILNSINGSCSSFNLGTLYNHQIVLPCINLENLLGSSLYTIIDVLISGLFILSFRKKMVDIFNNMTSLNDRGNELE